MRYLSPLRYPGGKARLAPYLERLITAQPTQPSRYAEPFAGGAGAALKLLRDDVVEHIHLNDLNPGIAAFWRSITEQPEEFCRLIESTDLTIEQWHIQRDRYLHPDGLTDLEFGFATFFLNRTNRSGILGARPIGGLDQKGKWKLDSRFNREGLITRVQLIAGLRERIHITQQEGLDFLASIAHHGDDLFVYADPPYLVQGEGLYLHAFDERDHLQLAEHLAASACPWMLTYDDDPRITDTLYGDGRCARFPIAHTAHKQHVGSEAVIFSSKLIVPDMELTTGRIAQWVR